MNRGLIDPFQSVALPDGVESTLAADQWACCAAFNHSATLLAAGCAGGEVLIWDFQTRGVAAIWRNGHTKMITCVAWSRDGRWLVSGGADGRVIRWNVENGVPELTQELSTHVVSVSVSPRRPDIAVASLASGQPILLDFRGGPVRPLPPIELEAAAGSRSGSAQPTSAAVLSKDGRLVYAALSARGLIVVYDAATLRVHDVIKMSSAARVSTMRLDGKGALLLAACSDRVVRLFELAPLMDAPPNAAPVAGGGDANLEACSAEGYSVQEVQAHIAAFPSLPKSGSLLRPHAPLLRTVREYDDPIEKRQWQSADFAHDSEHIAAASQGKADGNIFIWNVVTSKLHSVLEGPLERVMDITWHPHFNVLASVTAGKIIIFARDYQENWTAFAPDFTELEMNEDYEEREDEFDISERAEEQPAARPPSTDSEVDIMTGAAPDLSDSEGEGGHARPLRHLRTVILPDETLAQRHDGPVQIVGVGAATGHGAGQLPTVPMEMTASGQEAVSAEGVS